MICSDDVNRSIDKRLTQSHDIALCSQWWVHLEYRVVVLCQLFG